MIPVAFILSHLFPEKLKEPYSSGVQVVAGFEDTDVLCIVNGIARERNLVQSKDIGKANREEIKQAMDSVLTRMQGFDLAGFSRELGKLGFKVREARASTGKLNGYYVEARSGTEYKASEIGKGYTLAHIEKTQKNLKYNSISRNYGNTLKLKDGGLHL
ncbi:relaxase/mobilization nuclease domain-containing protein [Bacteroides ovatus]|nr:relaxase/mobilization nuclease domain-containing protein [Bacteroides ovatus]